MQRFFLPAIALLNRVGYTKKFTLLWLLSLIAVAVVAYSLFVSLNRVIQPSQRELEGLALIKPISQTVQFIQRHRVFSVELLGGNETMQDRRAVREKEAVEAFKAMEGMLPASLASSEDFQHIKASWNRLRKEGLNWSMAENLDAHSSLINQILLFETFVADEYALTLDPEIDTFYLIDTSVNKLPHALEHLGLLRAYGTSILFRKQVHEPQKVKLNALMVELGSTLDELKINLAKTGRYNPRMRDSVSTTSKDIVDLAQQLTNVVASDLLTGHFATSPEDFLDSATVVIDKSYAQLYESLLPTTEFLIKARIARAKNTLYTNTGISLLAFLLVVYLSVSIYYAIVGNIQSLVRSARSFAEGNLHERIKLDTHDELHLVGASFNEMADGFNAILEAHREDEARLNATFEKAMDAVVQMNAAGIIIGWNSQAEKIFGWSREEAVGRVLSETIIPPQYREAHINGLKHFLISGEGPVLNSRIEITGLHRNGHEFPIELSIAPIKVAGQTTGNYEFSAFIRDITESKQAEKKLQAAQRHEADALKELRVMLDSSGEGFWKVDQSGRIVEVNEAYCHITGYAREEIAGAHVSKFEAIEQTPDAVAAHIQRVVEQGHDRFETRHRHRDGHLVDIEVTASYIAETNCLIVFLRDVTKRKQTEEALRIAAIAFESQAAMMVTDLTPKILRVNRAFEEITGYTAAEAIGQNPNILRGEIKPVAFYEEMWATLLSKGKWSGEVLDKRKNGKTYPKWLTITAVAAPDGTITHYVGSFFDITERKKAEEDIHRLAFYDPLTNLPNRRLLLDRLQHALANSVRSGRHGAIMFIDLDNFKVINDTKGHNFGDLLLIEAARRLQFCVREGDTVARLGGDEFVVMLEDLGSEAEHAAAQAEEVAEKIRDALNQYYLIKEDEYISTASIGINLFADRETSAETLLKRADMAMYQAKGAGRNTLRFFDPKMQAILESRAAIEADLHRAIVGQQFRFYYQAQVDNDGRIFGAEALIRWIHPQRGMVPPFQFIPIAEESLLILDIGQWGLETACRQLALWGNDEQKCNLVLAVNVSVRQFKLNDFVDKVAAVIKEHRINPSRLKLELTESVVLTDVAGIVTKMHALKALGVGLSMDDFGTGYSSLSYLKQLPLDQLKIDRSFVNDIATDPNDAIMVRTIIDMAHNFRLNVIAEGVETEAQLAFLKQHGCMMYQGYLFSKPVPIEEFEALLNQG